MVSDNHFSSPQGNPELGDLNANNSSRFSGWCGNYSPSQNNQLMTTNSDSASNALYFSQNQNQIWYQHTGPSTINNGNPTSALLQSDYHPTASQHSLLQQFQSASYGPLQPHYNSINNNNNHQHHHHSGDEQSPPPPPPPPSLASSFHQHLYHPSSFPQHHHHHHSGPNNQYDQHELIQQQQQQQQMPSSSSTTPTIQLGHPSPYSVGSCTSSSRPNSSPESLPQFNIQSSNNNNNCNSTNHGPSTRPSTSRSPFGWIRRSHNQPSTGKTRTKDKYRVVYSEHQRAVLETEYIHGNKYITIRRKSDLANMLQLTERQVKIWFQNRRAKERKLQKKQQDQLRFNFK